MTAIRRLAGIAILLCALAPAAHAIDTPARHAILVDIGTGTVLLAKDADTQMPPASMSKLMTISMLFEALTEGRVKLDDSFEVSEKAWKMGGSKMFVEVGKQARIEDLIRGIVVQSGNDACIVVAEGLGGTEAAFATKMTERAHELGLTDSSFINASGWPDPDHHMSARDLAKLATHLILDFPEYYKYFAELEFTYAGIKQGNRNPLLYKDIGADGLKTGHTEASGYGLVASAVRDGRRLVLVVNGLESVNQRSRESARLLEWGFREFEAVKLFKAGETVADADVWLGGETTVPLVPAEPVEVLLPRAGRNELKVAVRYDGPVPAPITKGTRIATLTISAPEMEAKDVPLLAGADVERLGAVGRIFARLGHMVWGLASQQ
ncbi:MAG: D-alanyl-D-alanine carboxypeptidase family protein [Alphaproteobacteria bacterium]